MRLENYPIHEVLTTVLDMSEDEVIAILKDYNAEKLWEETKQN